MPFLVVVFVKSNEENEKAQIIVELMQIRPIIINGKWSGFYLQLRINW